MKFPALWCRSTSIRRLAVCEGAEGRQRGIDLAKEISEAALEHFPGVYLITPFLQL